MWEVNWRHAGNSLGVEEVVISAELQQTKGRAFGEEVEDGDSGDFGG